MPKPIGPRNVRVRMHQAVAGNPKLGCRIFQPWIFQTYHCYHLAQALTQADGLSGAEGSHWGLLWVEEAGPELRSLDSSFCSSLHAEWKVICAKYWHWLGVWLHAGHSRYIIILSDPLATLGGIHPHPHFLED